MKRIIITLLFAATGICLTAQTSETRNLDTFDEVSVSQGINVYMTKGSQETARIEIDGNIQLEEVLTEVSDGTLKIHLDGNNFRNVDVDVYLTFVKLEGLKASSAGSIQVKDKVSCDCNFDIDVSSAGEVEINLESNSLDLEASSAGNVDLVVKTGDIDADISSAGDIDIEGSARSVEVNASSSGDFSGNDLSCEVADLRASSGGSIEITVKKKIEARASSGGSISYRGNPEYVDKESSSGGSIRRD